MKTFTITVPYTYMVSGDFVITHTEEDIVEAFGVDSLDQIDPADLDQYLRDTADDEAYSIEDDEIYQLVREQKGLETQPDDITIEIEEEEAAE
jgi:hypothetical protein